MNTHLLVFKHLQSPAVSFLSLLLIVVVSNVASIVSNTLITSITSIVPVFTLLLVILASIASIVVSIASIVPVLSLLARLLLLSTFALLFAQRLETYLAFEDLFKVFFRGLKKVEKGSQYIAIVDKKQPHCCQDIIFSIIRMTNI